MRARSSQRNGNEKRMTLRKAKINKITEKKENDE